MGEGALEVAVEAFAVLIADQREPIVAGEDRLYLAQDAGLGGVIADAAAPIAVRLRLNRGDLSLKQGRLGVVRSHADRDPVARPRLVRGIVVQIDGQG